MNQLLQNFLRDIPRHLNALRRDLLELKRAADERTQQNLIRRVFQKMHTLKGSAAAFELDAVNGLAHELETLLGKLEFGEITFSQNALDALERGMDEIENSLRSVEESKGSDSSLDFLDEMRAFNENAETSNDSVLVKNILPAEFLQRLNERETKHLQQAARRNAAICAAEISFGFLEFNEKLKELRAALEEFGEIIATLPSATQASDKLALQIVFAAEPDFTTIIKKFGGEILFASEPEEISFAETYAMALLAGQTSAAKLGKEIEFELSGGDLRISQKQSDALADAFVHLVRNAVAHGIETPVERLEKGKSQRGLVRIEAKENSKEIRVKIGDDGRGIDFEKVAQAASALTGSEIEAACAQNLIFMSGLSTAEKLTDISGRGVGLDAVKSSIENIGGKIEVGSEQGIGTTFEIVLPQA